MQQINAKQMCSQHSCLSEVAASQEIFVVHTHVNTIDFVQTSDVQIDQRQFKFTNAFAKVHMSVIVTQMNLFELLNLKISKIVFKKKKKSLRIEVLQRKHPIHIQQWFWIWLHERFANFAKNKLNKQQINK